MESGRAARRYVCPECAERREREARRGGRGGWPRRVLEGAELELALVLEGRVRLQSEDGEHLRVRRAVKSLRTAMCRPRAAGKKGSQEES